MSFSPEEGAAILKAVTMSGMAVAIADMGIVSTAIEAAALAKEVVGAAAKYPTNSIIQSVFTEEALKTFKPETPKDVTPDNAVDMAIAAVNDALTTLESKATPAEITEYKQFIYSAATHVAEAAGSGLFGSGANKISPEEAATLAKLKTALAI